MKKITLLLSIMAFCIMVNAQRKGLTLSPIFQAGISNHNEGESSFLHAGFGLDTRIMFSDNLGLGVGLRYGLYSFWAGSTDPSMVDIMVRQSFLEAPITFSIITSKYRKVGANFNFGLLISESQKQDATAYYVDNTSETLDVSETVNDINIGFLTEIGLHAPIGSRFSMEPGIYLNYYLNDLYLPEYQTSGGIVSGGLYLRFSTQLNRLKKISKE